MGPWLYHSYSHCLQINMMAMVIEMDHEKIMTMIMKRDNKNYNNNHEMFQVRYVQPAEEEVCETKGGEEGQVMMMRRRIMMMTRNTGDEPSCQ